MQHCSKYHVVMQNSISNAHYRVSPSESAHILYYFTLIQTRLGTLVHPFYFKKAKRSNDRPPSWDISITIRNPSSSLPPTSTMPSSSSSSANSSESISIYSVQRPSSTQPTMANYKLEFVPSPDDAADDTTKPQL